MRLDRLVELTRPRCRNCRTNAATITLISQWGLERICRPCFELALDQLEEEAGE